MLIQPDINELGDKRLDPKEGLAKLKEENLVLAQQNKIPHQDLLDNPAAALGRPMHSSEFIRKITNLNPFVIVAEGGVPGCVAIRYPHLGNALAYITGFPLGPMPEYSCVVVDDRGVAKREIRGWREVLRALIRVDALKFDQCEKEFGPATGERAQRWDGMTRKLKEK